MSPEQEQLVSDALVNLGWVETEQGLHVESVIVIQDVLDCSLEEARATLLDLRVRGRIEETADKQLNQLRFRWVRPSA